jgi:hypothetical protein
MENQGSRDEHRSIDKYRSMIGELLSQHLAKRLVSKLTLSRLLTLLFVAVLYATGANAQAPETPKLPTLSRITATSVTITAPALPANASYLVLSGKSEFDDSFVDITFNLAGASQTIVKDLMPSTAYTFRYTAVGAGGSTAGSEASFTTKAMLGGPLLSANLGLRGQDIQELQLGPPPPPYPDPWPSGSGAAKEATELLSHTLQALDAAQVSRRRIVQAIGNVRASWGTHYADGRYKGKLYGAAVDISVRRLSANGYPTGEYMDVPRINEMVRAIRRQGMAAWFRKWPGNWHIHAIDPGAPNIKWSRLRLDKYAQFRQFVVGKDGTAHRNRRDPQTSIRPSEIDAVKTRWNKRLK